MTDAPDPRDERDEQDRQDQPEQSEPARRSGRSAGSPRSGRTGGRASGKTSGRSTGKDGKTDREAGAEAGRKGSGPGAGASRGGDPGRSGRTSGGARRRTAPAPRPTDTAGGAGPDEPTEAGAGRHDDPGIETGATEPNARATRSRDGQPAGRGAPGGQDDPGIETGADQAGATGPGVRATGGRRDRPSGSAPGADDPAERYLAAYLDAVERGDDPPDLGELKPGARSDVEAVLALLAGDTPGTGDRPTGAGNPHADGDRGRGRGRETSDRRGGEPDLRPLGESEFAIEHGLSRTNPDVVVAGPAVRRARAVTGMTPVDVAEEMARRGHAIAAEAVEALEQRTAHRMHPRDARLLAAVLDLPLDTIEAAAAPWSADPAALAELAGADTDRNHTGGTHAGDSHAGGPTVTPIVLGDDVVLRTGTGSHLGVLRGAGGADVLDSRTYRQAAASRLVGPWSHLAGALLVADEAPHLALAVDALDCVARQHAPSGLIGFSRLAEPETIAAALASYDRAYAIDWSDPDPLEGLATRPDQATRALAGRIEALAGRLADEARRSRQTGKRPGYAAAARWLRSTPPADVVALLDELAQADPDAARRRIDELAQVVLA